jgi:hypothetical protein
MVGWREQAEKEKEKTADSRQQTAESMLPIADRGGPLGWPPVGGMKPTYAAYAFDVREPRSWFKRKMISML